MLTDGIQRDVRTAFNDEFIVDVADDLTAAEGFHGVGQDIPTHGLHDVLDKFWTVRFDPGPVLCGIDPHVGDRLSAEAVLADPGFHVREPPAGWQRNEQHAALYYKSDVANSCLAPLFNRFFDGGIHSPPVGSDVRVTAAPHVYQGLQLILRKPHIEGAHGGKSTDAAAIAKGKLGNFAFLPEVAVNAVLFNRNAEHPAGALALSQ